MTETTEANELKLLINKRLDLKENEEIDCPRAKSLMTPCIARDGQLAVTRYGGENGYEICVGCGDRVTELLLIERGKHPKKEGEQDGDKAL